MEDSYAILELIAYFGFGFIFGYFVLGNLFSK